MRCFTIVIISCALIVVGLLFSRKESFDNSNSLEVKKSNINGKGVFAKKNFQPGDVVFSDLFKNRPRGTVIKNTLPEELFDKYIVPRGKFVNHCSVNFNTITDKKNNAHRLIAVKHIKVGDEITNNYDHTNEKFPFIEHSFPGWAKC